MNSQAFVFFGRSGCGKGTQAKLLASYLKEKGKDVLPIGTGKAFREFATGDSLASKNVQDILKDGGLPPVFLPIWIWTDFIIKNFTGKEYIIFDGVCRRFEEAIALNSLFEFYKIEKPTIVLINVSKEQSYERMLERKRADDTPEEIQSRLTWFDKDVVPSIEYFREKAGYHFVEVNGEQAIEKVHEDIIKAIGY